MEIDLLYELIGNFGFPIAITIYLLLRLEKKIAELTSAITKLREDVNTKL
ncbi:YvrJ family protein [Alkalibacillus haloalkaliphilus]|nr:YvrJ family protein [Alkalibacillus haloalkaliphilus]MDV2583475.1 YvrJ family protein [Alkalibacillus haloalkaliphilus]